MNKNKLLINLLIGICSVAIADLALTLEAKLGNVLLESLNKPAPYLNISSWKIYMLVLLLVVSSAIPALIKEGSVTQ